MAKSKKNRFSARSQRREAVAFSYGTPQKPEQYKVIEYGKDNKLPHDMIRVFSESPTAMLCWEKKAKFIKADGFDGPASALRVNKDQLLDDLLQDIAFDSAVFGFALRVKYKADLSVGEIYHVPFQHVLKLTDGRFLVNPTLGSKDYKKEQDELLDAFDDSPDKVRPIVQKAQALDAKNGPSPEHQPGQLLYVYVKNSLRPHYPVPACWAGRVDMETEPYILKADLKGIRDRVRAGIKVFVPGNIDDETKDDSGKTDLDHINDNIVSLFDEDTLYAVFSGPTKDDTPQIEFLDSFATLGSSSPMRETIGRAICRWWGMAPELMGWATAGQLGNKEQLGTIVGMLQQDVLDIQGLIQRTIERLYPSFKAPLTNYNILGDIPSHVWEIMTPDEKRNSAGLAELEQPNTTTDGANASGLSRIRAFFKKH